MVRVEEKIEVFSSFKFPEFPNSLFAFLPFFPLFFGMECNSKHSLSRLLCGLLPTLRDIYGAVKSSLHFGSTTTTTQKTTDSHQFAIHITGSPWNWKQVSFRNLWKIYEIILHSKRKTWVCSIFDWFWMDEWMDGWMAWMEEVWSNWPQFESRKRVTKVGTQFHRVNTYNVNCVHSWRSHSGHFGPESACVAISGLWPANGMDALFVDWSH